tara:strand:- start:739 stop:951 length:213 start_codon:yes stop_codon:yes gene_type:complete
MRYYFITYQATTSASYVQSWNECISISPMEYIKKVEEAEDKSKQSYWRNFVVTNIHEITEEEYFDYNDTF